MGLKLIFGEICHCFINYNCKQLQLIFVKCLTFHLHFNSNHNGSTPLVLAKRRGVNKDAIRLLEGLEEQEVKGFNRGAHSKLEAMQMAESERSDDPHTSYTYFIKPR